MRISGIHKILYDKKNLWHVKMYYYYVLREIKVHEQV